MALVLGSVDGVILYVNGKVVTGNAQVTLPVISFKNVENNSSGLAGSINCASTSSLAPMEASFMFEGNLDTNMQLMNPSIIRTIEVNSGSPNIDFNFNNVTLSSNRCVLVGQIYECNAGQRKNGEKNEIEFKMNVWKFKMYNNGVETLAVDATDPTDLLRVAGIGYGLSSILKSLI
jgi:phage tail tube protein FII